MKVVSFSRNNRIRVIALLLVAVVTLSIFAINARADLKMDENALVTVHVTDASVPNGYLAMGVHLIYLGSLTEELYDLALDSGADFSQYNIYYKSELSNGAWYDITDAYSLGNITDDGKLVSASVIEGLEFMYKTDENGITIDLLTNEVVNLFDLKDPYDLEAMKELEPLRIQYNILNQKSGDNLTDSDELYMEMIEDFFDAKISNSESDQWDRGLNALEWYKRITIKNEKKPTWTSMVSNIMGQADATRRVIAYTNLTRNLDALLAMASGTQSMVTPAPSPSPDVTPEPAPEEEVNTSLEINTDIIEAIGTCLENVSTSLNSYAGKQIEEGTTISSKQRFAYVKELISNAISSNESACDVTIRKLVDMDNIMQGIKADNDSEYSTIAEDMIKNAYTQFAAAVHSGVSAEYRQTQAAGLGVAALNQCLTDQKANTKATESEYETLLEAMFDRMEAKSASQVTLKLLDDIPKLKNGVPSDAANSAMLEVVEDHRVWLQSEYAKLLEKAGDDSEKSKLQSEYDELAAKRNQALNENDLGTAAELEALMLAKKTDIDNLDASFVKILNDPNSSEADKARANAGLSGDSISRLAVEAGTELAGNIREGNLSEDELNSQLATLAAIGELDPDSTKAALAEVQAALDNAGKNDVDTSSVSDGIEKGIENGNSNEANGDSSLGNIGSDTGAGSGLGSKLSRDEMMALLESLLGKNFEDASSSEQAAAVLAIEWYGDRKNYSEAYVLSGSLASKAQNGNPYLFNKLSSNAKEHITVSALAGIMDYRYIFDDKLSQAIMQKGKNFYSFTAGSGQYRMTGDVTKKLKSTAVISNRELYVSETDSDGIFGIKTCYLKKVTLGVGYDGTCESRALEMLEVLLQGGL